MVRQLVRPRLQLRIAQLLFPADHSHRLRRAFRLRAEQLMHATLPRIGPRRRVPLHQQTLTLLRAQQVQVAQPARRIRHHLLQNPLQVLREPRHRRGVEQVGRVLEAPLQPSRALPQA